MARVSDKPGYDLALIPRNCDCGHEGLDAMFHLTPCPQARVWKHRARSQDEPGSDGTPSGVGAEGSDGFSSAQELPVAAWDDCPLQETYPGSGIYE